MLFRSAVKELISEENRRPTYHMSSSDHVLATPSPQPPITAFTTPPRINPGHPNSQSSKGTYCEFYRSKGHDIFVCRKLQKFVQEHNKASLPRAAAICPSDPSVPTGPSLTSRLFNRFYLAFPLPFLSPQVNNLGSLILHVVTI